MSVFIAPRVRNTEAAGCTTHPPTSKAIDAAVHRAVAQQRALDAVKTQKLLDAQAVKDENAVQLAAHAQRVKDAAVLKKVNDARANDKHRHIWYGIAGGAVSALGILALAATAPETG
jgi:high-affinity Fe2+/Pb2+ permease